MESLIKQGSTDVWKEITVDTRHITAKEEA